MDWLNGALKNKFAAARAKPWTPAYASVNEDMLCSGLLSVEGSLPRDLRGTFYRNGPARHERGQARYAHKWDGDGMIQAFVFRDGTVSHRGRYVATAKYLAETEAGRFQFSAYGSAIAGRTELTTDIDAMNAANISVCVHGGELLALWEPGSAYTLDPDTLSTLGLKQWNAPLPLCPFSAHPKLESDGRLWNFGCDPLAGVLSIHAISPNGKVEQQRQFDVARLPPIHDFAVTRHHLVFVLPPLEVAVERIEAGRPFGASVLWAAGRSTRVLVIDKRTWAMRWYELPPAVFSHIGNAWEDDDGVIRFDCMSGHHAQWALHGWSVMRGLYAHVRGSSLTWVELRPNGSCTAGMDRTLEAEFPVVEPRVVGQRYQALLCISRSTGRPLDLPGWDRLTAVDVEDGSASFYDFGDDWMLEEHLYVPDAGQPDAKARWIVGTALNLRTAKTVLSVFAADAIQAGPVAQAVLPYALPVGLHGTFRATS